MLLSSDNKQVALEAFSKLRRDHFSDAFTSIYHSIQTYYKKHNAMPSIDALMFESNRNARLSQALTVLANTQIPDVDMAHAISVLEAEYTQELFLQLLETDVLTDITMLDQGELLERVAALHMKLEDRVTSTGKVFDADSMRVFQREEDAKLNLISLGISNEFDAKIGGIGRTETLLLGGWRGTGKSILCSNIQIGQYNVGDIAPYFSVEMKEGEVFRRNLAIMAKVSALAIRNGTLEGHDLHRLARTRAKMFNGGEELYMNIAKKHELMKMGDFYDMESELMDRYELHTPMVIIYDPDLSITTIDVELNKLSAKYGDRMTLAIVDYINQVKLAGTDALSQYDWKEQMVVSKSFKGLCQKYNVGGVSPYQIDKEGNARMAKGILDSADMAANLNAAKADNGKGGILLDFVKTRNSGEVKFMPEIDWNTLSIDPTRDLSMEDIQQMQADFVIPLEKEKSEKPMRRAKKEETPSGGERTADI